MSEGNSSLIPQPGTLYVVATPIGNLADVSKRAEAILNSVDLVACEDTRTTRVLLHHIGASAERSELVAYHEHNEKHVAPQLADRLQEGKSIAIVSDAGTPGLSDPGFRIVRECRRRGIPVVPVPGPSALVALLSSSGLPTNAFSYFGFLPAKKSARRAFLEKHAGEPNTIALFESCHRISAFLDEIVEILGTERVIAVGKELTKIHETILVGKSGEVHAQLSAVPIKGEFALLIAPASFEL
jgi:16S rRNA (cytidine1402-2'-O)-methyltransferase